jgi:hypothetical protein
MGILVIITMTILEPFRIVIHHRLNSISKSFLVVYLVAFQCFCLFVSCWFCYAFSMFLFVCILLILLPLFNVFFHLFIYILLWTSLMNYIFIGILLRCSHNPTNQKGCWITKKNNQNWIKFYVLPFKAMEIMASFFFHSYEC